jgi:dTDP-4-amino-4,6-dideoxygalactose transaminase
VAIPLVDVRAQYAPLQAELERRIGEVLGSGRFILGPEVRAFEAEAASYLGVRETVGVGNGTDALVLVLDALGVGPGDEVICPAFTFFATAEAIARRGATPVFADIDAATLNLDPADVAKRVTARTKAVLVVHLFGRPAPVSDMPAGIPVIEDTAQAFGATAGGSRAGALGTVGTFSFFPSKNLFGLGDGGLVASDDADLAGRVRLLRSHGSRDKQTFETIGYNSRLDELQASALRLFLSRLDEWNLARRAAAARYAELGLGELCELPADEPGHVYYVYAVRLQERARVVAALEAAEIGHAAYYSTALHLQPAFGSLGYGEGSLPETERAGREVLALPIWPSITPEQQQEVVETIRAAVTLRAAS